MAKSKPLFYFKYLAFVFAVVINILGCFVVEFESIYLPELAINSYYAGSLPMLVFGRWLFIVVLLTYDSLWGVEATPNATCTSSNQKWIEALSWIVFAASLACFVSVADHPAFLAGLDRFKYANEYGSGLISSIATVLSVLVVFPIMHFRDTGKKIGLLAVAVFCLYLLWTGVKFGSFFNILCVFVLVYYERIIRFSKDFLVKFLSVLFIFITLLVGGAVILHGMTSTVESNDYISLRLAEQGQLWWRTYDLYNANNHPDDFVVELDALFSSKESVSENIGSHNGIYGIMYLTTPSTIVDKKLSSGSRYTEGGYAAVFYYFGVLGVVLFSIIMGIAVGLIQNAALRAIQGKKLVDCYIQLRFVSLIKTALSMFLFSSFLGIISIICYGILIIAYISGGWRREARLRSVEESVATKRVSIES
jgi:hypothetical protein